MSTSRRRPIPEDGLTTFAEDDLAAGAALAGGAPEVGRYGEATPFDLSEFDGQRLPTFLNEVADAEGRVSERDE